MKTKIFLIITLVGLSLGFTSCEVDFNPNDDWKETTIGYGILDQDDDTTFVRVEKCFLGQGNALQFAKEKDSIYYKEGDIDVKMNAYWDWDTNNVVGTFQFKYKTVNKSEGSFYSGECPIYYCVTKKQLNPSMVYRIVVTNNKTGNVVTAKTQPLGKYSITTNYLTFNEKGKRLKVSWTNIDENEKGLIGKQYQVSVRFRFNVDGKKDSVDIPLSKKVNTYSSASSMLSTISLTDVLSGIKQQLKDKTSHTLTMVSEYPFALCVSACNQDMYDYISINNTENSYISYKPTFSNVINGIGLFASRRTHIYYNYKFAEVDNNLTSGIKALGLGF